MTFALTTITFYGGFGIHVTLGYCHRIEANTRSDSFTRTTTSSMHLEFGTLLALMACEIDILFASHTLFSRSLFRFYSVTCKHGAVSKEPPSMSKDFILWIMW